MALAKAASELRAKKEAEQKEKAKAQEEAMKLKKLESISAATAKASRTIQADLSTLALVRTCSSVYLILMCLVRATAVEPEHRRSVGARGRIPNVQAAAGVWAVH